MRPRTLIALTAALFLTGPASGINAGENSKGMLQGAWSLISVEIDNQALPMDDLKESRLVVSGVDYSFALRTERLEMTHKIDSSKTPKWLDMTVLAGSDKGKTYHAIFKLEGDTLTICRNIQPDKRRPTTFATRRRSGLMLIVWKRTRP